MFITKRLRAWQTDGWRDDATLADDSFMAMASISRFRSPMMPRQTHSNGENMPDIPSLTAEVGRLGHAVGFWNAAIIVLMVGVAVVATGLVIAQQMAFKRADALASATDQLSKLKEGVADQKIAEANERAGRAEQSAGEANERAAKAQASLALAEQHAAEANTKAEGFRLDIAKADEASARAQAQVAGATAEAAKASLELAKLKTPRTLSPEQQRRVSTKIEPFPNTPFDMWVSTDSDSTTLMGLMDEAIRAGKWQFKPAGIIQFANKAGLISGSGVSIHFAEEQRSVLEQPALTLGNALIAEGIPVVVFRDTGDANKDKDKTAIHVMIGSKPMN